MLKRVAPVCGGLDVSGVLLLLLPPSPPQADRTRVRARAKGEDQACRCGKHFANAKFCEFITYGFYPLFHLIIQFITTPRQRVLLGC